MPLLELADIGNIAGSRSILKGIDLMLEFSRIYGFVGQCGSGVCMDVPSHPQRHEPISYLL